MILTEQQTLLTPRWYPLKPHPIQMELVHTKARFAVVPAGRRSGKTERAKRKLIRAALSETEWPDARFFAAAPTRQQAKDIFWEHLKALMPKWALLERPSETELSIKTILGTEIRVVGLDKPERIEGSPWNGGVLDEFANMKPKAWGENVRPVLSDRHGWCWLTGVPEGRNHYYDLYEKALADTTGEWRVFHWKSSEIIDPAEIEAARTDLDPLTFEQEYEGSFLNFQGRAYYVFDAKLHCSTSVLYQPKLDLNLCFDFNVSPGTASACQEMVLPNGTHGTGFVGEVYIPRNSNTPAVCRKLIEMYKDHRAAVYCYGDYTGDSDGTAKIQGSDWDLIRRDLRAVFGDRLHMKIKPNPTERARVNSMNTRLLSGDGTVRLMVNPAKCPKLVKDFEGVRTLEGGSGELDKKSDPMLTHLTDGAGYYVDYNYPVRARTATQKEMKM